MSIASKTGVLARPAPGRPPAQVRFRGPVIDAVVPARNESATVASVVGACLGCPSVREVVVVDDGSVDNTADVAMASGAKVVRRDWTADAAVHVASASAARRLRRDGTGSKAHAMAVGVAATDADAILFVDADLLGLTSGHLEDVCRPFLEGRATMSLGWFDYGWWNSLVLRLPPTTGERVVPRWVFEAVPPERQAGYTIEMMINEVIAEARLPTTARIMRGVTHRTKRQKFGVLDGYRRTWRMFYDIVQLPLRGVIRWRTYWFYLKGLTVDR